jgi:peptide/nickel transport system permease protein
MAQYIARRVLLMIPTLIVISIISFIIIQLPPGDYLSSYVATLLEQGDIVDEQILENMRRRYGLGQPVYVQYLKWVWGMLHGDFGKSMEWQVSVSSLIWERLALTFALSVFTMLFTWSLAIPVGVFSATHQYSIADYTFTFFGFVGLGVPNFMLALILMYVAMTVFGQTVGGLFSAEFIRAPWSWAKFVDMLKHIWIPMIILGTGGTAGLIRTMRAQMLDELPKPYVVTGRAKGLSERKLIWKYPVRVAMNPFFSGLSTALPNLISGSTIVSVVLSLQTTGPLMWRALRSQDMYLAGSFLLMLSILTVISTLLSDIVLAAMDPRIRYQD